MRTALIAGATGLVGGECLRRLLADSEYDGVIALVRRPLAAHPKLESKVVEFERLPSSDVSRVDDVFCALGTTIKKAGSQGAFRTVDYEYPKLVAEFGKRCGATRVALVSSVGADASSSTFFLRVKGETELAVSAVGFESVSIFRPSLLLGERADRRWAEQISAPFFRAFSFLLIGGLRRYRAVDASVVGQAMVDAVKAGLPGTVVHEFGKD